MTTKISSDKVANDAKNIEKVWKTKPDMTLGKNDDDKVTLVDYQGSKKAVDDWEDKIEDARNVLTGLLDSRDDSALKLSGLNTRALSAIRGIFGPDSAEYDQAGGTRTSERKKPVRKNGNTPQNN